MSANRSKKNYVVGMARRVEERRATYAMVNSTDDKRFNLRTYLKTKHQPGEGESNLKPAYVSMEVMMQKGKTKPYDLTSKEQKQMLFFIRQNVDRVRDVFEEFLRRVPARRRRARTTAALGT